jgi:hypothetical protein
VKPSLIIYSCLAGSEYHDVVGMVRSVFRMKRFCSVGLGLLMSVLASSAQSTKPATVHSHRAKASATASVHHHAITAPPSSKPPAGVRSVDDQLNKLERDSARSLGAKSKSPGSKTGHFDASKSNDGTARRQPMNFRYQAPAGASTGSQTGQSSARNRSGLRRRVNPGAR